MPESKEERFNVSIGGIAITDSSKGGALICQYAPVANYMGWSRAQLLGFEAWTLRPQVASIFAKFATDITAKLQELGVDYAKTKEDFDPAQFTKMMQALSALKDK